MGCEGPEEVGELLLVAKHHRGGEVGHLGQMFVLASGSQISVYQFQIIFFSVFHRGCTLGTLLATCINWGNKQINKSIFTQILLGVGRRSTC